MTQAQHIIFDLDGTLIHSAPDIHAAINTALQSVGRPVLSLEQVISFIGNGVEVLVSRSLEFTGEWNDALQAQTLACFLKAYGDDPNSRTKPYPGVVACLERFRSAGHKLAICTNKPEATARDICAALDLSDYFDVIAGARIGVPKKPDPAPLLEVIQSIGGTPENAIYVGDSAIDQATAVNAGVRFVLFSGGYLNSELSGPAPVLTFDDWTSGWYHSLGL